MASREGAREFLVIVQPLAGVIPRPSAVNGSQYPQAFTIPLARWFR